MARCSLLVLLLISLVFPARAQDTDTILETVQGLRPIAMDEVLWLARCLYSESNLSHEQELVAWVVRNRVETQYRGATYREVVLEPSQFSAFNRPSRRRSYLLGLDQFTDSAPWKRTLAIAYRVYMAPRPDRPFAIDTRHFYSPVSMPGGRAPAWADSGLELSSIALGVDPDRFRFFAGIDERVDEAPLAQPQIAGANTARERIDEFKESAPPEPEARPVEVSGNAPAWTPPLRFSGRIQRPARPNRKQERRPSLRSEMTLLNEGPSLKLQRTLLDDERKRP